MMLLLLTTCDTMLTSAKIDTRAFASLDQKLHDVTTESLVVKDLPTIGKSRAILAEVQIPDGKEVFAFMDTKRCNKCGRELPATTEWFHKSDGHLYSCCKDCKCRDRRNRYQINPERWRDYSRQYRTANRVKVREYKRRYRAANPDKERDYKRKIRQTDPDKVREYKRHYRQVNADKVRHYRQTNPEIFKAATQRRLARKRNLPNTLTAQDWQTALDYFGGRCAVCGRPPGLWHTIAADHWIPLSSPDCPGTVPENIVPLCHGIDGCNNSKNDRDSREWLIEKFGERKAKQIQKRIQAYFDSLKETQ